MSTSNSSGPKFLPLGAIIQELRINNKNIVLGFPTQDHYIKHNTRYFGATIGRVANRIKDGLIQSLNGRAYQLALHKGPNALHGGPEGWSKRIFEGPFQVERDGKEAVLFRYLSPDGEEEYPGTVEVRVWYITSQEEEEIGVVKTVLTVEYEVEFVGDECEETVVNMTNHSYFNIGDGQTIDDTTAQLFTDEYLPLDSSGIPEGTVNKFPRPVTSPFKLSSTEQHIDDLFIMEKDVSKIPLDTRCLATRKLAKFSHANTGIHFEVHSTEPAFQFYTGNNISVPATDDTPEYCQGAGFCVEPSRYVNAVNDSRWRGMVVLKRGQVFGCTNVYKVWEE